MSQLFTLLLNYEIDIVMQMTMILGTSVAGLVGLVALQQPKLSAAATNTTRHRDDHGRVQDATGNFEWTESGTVKMW